MTDTKHRTDSKSERIVELQREKEVLRDTLLGLCETIIDSTFYDPALYAKAEALQVLANGMAEEHSA